MVPNSFFELDVEGRFAALLLVDEQSAEEQRQLAKSAIKCMPYEDFLETTYWKTVRDYVVHKHDGQCYSCVSAKAVNVHHRTYAHHGEEHRYLTDLMPVCRTCHQILHEKRERDSHATEDRLQNVFHLLAQHINEVQS